MQVIIIDRNGKYFGILLNMRIETAFVDKNYECDGIFLIYSQMHSR